MQTKYMESYLVPTVGKASGTPKRALQIIRGYVHDQSQLHLCRFPYRSIIRTRLCARLIGIGGETEWPLSPLFRAYPGPKGPKRQTAWGMWYSNQ